MKRNKRIIKRIAIISCFMAGVVVIALSKYSNAKADTALQRSGSTSNSNIKATLTFDEVTLGPADPGHVTFDEDYFISVSSCSGTANGVIVTSKVENLKVSGTENQYVSSTVMAVDSSGSFERANRGRAKNSINTVVVVPDIDYATSWNYLYPDTKSTTFTSQLTYTFNNDGTFEKSGWDKTKTYTMTTKEEFEKAFNNSSSGSGSTSSTGSSGSSGSTSSSGSSSSSSSSTSTQTGKKCTKAEAEAAIFDFMYYSRTYHDLYVAFGYNTTNLKNHYNAAGKKEGRMPSAMFDPVYYLANNPDVAAAYGSNNYVGAYDHFVTYGLNEGRAGSELFSAKYYLSAYPDIANAYGNAGYYEALCHFNRCVVNGNEFRQGSAYFNLSAYKNNYQDLINAYGNANMQYFCHWIRCGKSEGRSGI